MVEQWGREGILGRSKRSSILELLDLEKPWEIQERVLGKQRHREKNEVLDLRVRGTEARKTMRICHATGKAW